MIEEDKCNSCYWQFVIEPFCVKDKCEYKDRVTDKTLFD